MQRALLFISRCQNLESAHNTTPFAAKLNDGGFYYTPAAGGSSQAGVDETTGGLRSYASMTYAGLKSMIYAGVKADDQRVKAAIVWIKKNYDLDTNPGMGSAGQYYYYHTFAKALAALGEDTLVDDKGVSHDWRKELIEELASRQREDGSWVNENSKWLEGDANLVTAYALLALSYSKK
jgi:squalene-hopene/tetraprenyl-beta-curcumene cyclase